MHTLLRSKIKYYLESIVLNKNFHKRFCRNCFIVVKSFPRKELPRKIFIKNVFGQTLLLKYYPKFKFKIVMKHLLPIILHLYAKITFELLDSGPWVKLPNVYAGDIFRDIVFWRLITNFSRKTLVESVDSPVSELLTINKH